MCGVALVDELAAVLADLAVGERAAQRPAAAADPVRRLVDLGHVARVPERVRGAEPGEAGADDDDLRRRGPACGRREAAERGEAERRDAGFLDEAAARRAALVGGDAPRRRPERHLRVACVPWLLIPFPGVTRSR